MHLLTLAPFYPTAANEGSGCFIAEPLRLLPPLGVECSVVAVQPWYRARVAASPAASPATWVRYPAIPWGLGLSSAGTFLFARLLSKVRNLHREHPLDLIHAHGALPCGHAAALLSRELNVPFVVTVHGLDAFFTNQVRGLPGEWCKRVSRMVYRDAAQVICISEKVRDQVLSGAPAQTSVIYNGVDPELFYPPRDRRDAGYILSVGNLIPIKGHELLLRAFAALPQSHSSLQIIGEGPERARLTALAASLGVASRVEFLGRRSRGQVAEAMRQCAIFALPSRYEGLGCVYLEAMASGVPVIACRGQSIEEVMQQGVNGWLVEPENLPSLTQALASLLGDSSLRRRMGNAARETILRGFTLAHQALALEELYRHCLSLPPSR